ncbi:unnamed protein product [Brachionus calyciflorus]|uniref:Uncharacterized protein n=1 Tax=Brachionus calyciflorus TaxID=104777 RepID=A0A813W3F7_9BILA|nr:unnamed protein product [Brachionus calyciflorus]
MKFNREKTMTDQFNRLYFTSDSVISALGMSFKNKKNIKLIGFSSNINHKTKNQASEDDKDDESDDQEETDLKYNESTMSLVLMNNMKI